MNLSNAKCETAVSSKCTSCYFGYYLDISNTLIPKCTICNASCKTCSNLTICLTCMESYFLSGNFCLSC